MNAVRTNGTPESRGSQPQQAQSLEERYEEVITHLTARERDLAEVDQVLRDFYFARLSLSSIQPVLDLARKRIGTRG